LAKAEKEKIDKINDRDNSNEIISYSFIHYSSLIYWKEYLFFSKMLQVFFKYLFSINKKFSTFLLVDGR
tara:strand:+ start:955 stop:1161 length:207 start_codon:yes stop_codon:yes gene_type:complete